MSVRTGRWARWGTVVAAAAAAATAVTAGPAGARSADLQLVGTAAGPGAPRPTGPPGGWQITDPATNGQIEGYAGETDVLPGGPVDLYVSTTAPTFTVTAYRMGWYGGAQGQEVWQSLPEPGKVQPAPTVAPSTHTVSTDWSLSLTVNTNGWAAGDYLFRLNASTGYQSYVPMTVRSASTAGKLVLLNAVTTWQAYNTWGGYSLYYGPNGTPRAYIVSFDRPYSEGDGAGQFLMHELPVVSLAEKLGLPLAYETSIDLHSIPTLLSGAVGVVSLGHDEYYSLDMRNALNNARDDGVNIAFLGANAIFRHIRLDPSPLGPYRLEVNYRVAALDPEDSWANKSDVTVDWPNPPDPRPESALTGAMYRCNPVDASLVVVDPGNWLFAGMNLSAGEGIPELAGPEYDRVVLSDPTPRPLEILAHSPVTCVGQPDFQDTTYYSTQSGAGVFDSGTWGWVCTMDDGCPDPRGTAATRSFLATVTARLLTVFAQPRVGFTHPAQDNVSKYYPTG